MMEKIKAGEITGQTGDYMLRATAANGQIRAFAATSRDLVEKARQAHNTSPVATAALGRLMTAGVMMGSMMKADSDLLTIRVEGDGPPGPFPYLTSSSPAPAHRSSFQVPRSSLPLLPEAAG